jgi:hypothetical protein
MSVYDQSSANELAVLRQRAEGASKISTDAQERDIQTALVASVGGEAYALSIEALSTVYDAPVITPLPSVPPYVVGFTVGGRHMLTPSSNSCKGAHR